nr:GTP 3',8-cyclase MoaA [Desulfobulbaceae bacterium]
MNKRAVHFDELSQYCLDKLIDNHGRPISYLRIAVTDRCNLRCQYCMPPEGIPFDGHDAILSYEEILRILEIAGSLGISKIRFTGGEPFARKDFMHLFEKAVAVPGIEQIHITTNGVSLAEHVPVLKELGVSGINLSLDTLDAVRFLEITRRNYFKEVMNSIERVLEASIPLKINSVIQDGFNTDEIVDLARIAQHKPVTVRFIEQMPFNGSGYKVGDVWDGNKILGELRKTWPAIERVVCQSGTAKLFAVPVFAGMIGIINAYSRQFCKTCNKIRVTPTGMLKTCLYDNGVVDLKALLRGGQDDQRLKDAIVASVNNRFLNGHEAQAASLDGQKPSMATIGG